MRDNLGRYAKGLSSIWGMAAASEARQNVLLHPSAQYLVPFDYDHPLLAQGKMARFIARDKDTADRYGRIVLAAEMSNAQYAERHQHLAEANNMRPPPSHHRIFSGYVVVRRIGHSDRYETWMPDHVFAELYAPEAAGK